MKSVRAKSPYRVQMERLRAEYEAGDKAALALAISVCGIRRKVLPAWVDEAWRGGSLQVAKRVADWNDLLGEVKLRTPKQLNRERRDLERLGKLVTLLPLLRKPIERDSEGAFRELAGKMGEGIRPRAVRELYYRKLKFNGEEIRLLPPWVLRSRAPRK